VRARATARRVLGKARQHLQGFLLRHGRIYRGVRGFPPHEEVRGDIDGLSLLFTEPDTTTAAVTGYTNSKSRTVSGSVGINASDGPSVSASASVTVGQSVSVTVPPLTIDNASNPLTAEAKWYLRPQGALAVNQLFSPAVGWVWIIPRSGYPGGGVGSDGINYVFDAGNVIGFSLCNVSFPFPEWTITAPEITSVIPDATKSGGGTFNIRGLRMYPGIVADVLLGGEALPQSNYQVISEHEIRVTVPAGEAAGQHPVQVVTEFEGSRLPSNADIVVRIQPRSAAPTKPPADVAPGTL
jgi:hypothetical protein